MAKVRIHVFAEEDLMVEFKAIAERNRWPYATATEIAIEQFVNRYRHVQIPGLVEVTANESPADQMRANGVAPLLEEAA